MKKNKENNTKEDSIKKTSETQSDFNSDIKVISQDSQFNSYFAKMLEANKIWIISDTHFYHKNIIKYTNSPSNRDAIMIKNWVNAVKEDEVILHLGDLLFPSGKEKYENNLTYKLTGKKYIIKGNHDKLPTYWYQDQGYNVIPSFEIKFNQNHFIFTHRPGGDYKPYNDLRIVEKGPNYYNIHGHIHNNGYHNEEKNHRLINMSVEVIDFKPVKLKELIANI